MTDTLSTRMLRIAHETEASTDSGDERAVARHIAGVLVTDDMDQREISDACARTIASWFAIGHGPGQAFVSTGTVPVDSGDLYHDLCGGPAGYDSWSPFSKLCADMLGTYLVNRADRGTPVAGWSDLWVR